MSRPLHQDTWGDGIGSGWPHDRGTGYRQPVRRGRNHDWIIWPFVIVAWLLLILAWTYTPEIHAWLDNVVRP